MATDSIVKHAAPVLQGKEAAGDLAKHMNTLGIFAFGTLTEYQQKKAKCLDLNPKMQRKLQTLTLVDLASSNPRLSYNDIAIQCGLPKQNDTALVTEVESLVLEAYQHQLLQVRIDQRERCIYVIGVTGRDVR